MEQNTPAWALASAAAAVILGCADLGSGKPSADRKEPLEVQVKFDPPASDGFVASVVRVSLTPNRPSPDSVSLFQGALTSRELKDLAAGTPSKVLQARQVPILQWSNNAETEVAHTNRLQAAASYTLAVPSWGWTHSFQVLPKDDAPFLKRVWPPV